MQDVFYYDDDELTREIIMGEGLIKWAYQDDSVSLLSRLLFHNRFCSTLLGLYFNSGFSRPKIAAAIADLKIDTSEFADPLESYKTFNQFFYRHLDLQRCRPCSADVQSCAMPADGRVLVYPQFDGDMLIPVKGRSYSVREFLQIDDERFDDGALAVIRLCPADYHRYHYPFDGEIVGERAIEGAYHSVNPLALALGIDVFCQNKRSYSLLQSELFGTVAYVEVGAFGVGSILRSNDAHSFKKMDERGYFAFGGSTIVLVFQKERIAFDERLLRNSREGYETLVKVGQELGRQVV